MQPARPDWYDWPGGREAMLRFGPDDGPVVVAALPFWDEANRSRHLVAAMLRHLAARRIGGVLPDLPGMGDSPVATAATRLSAMRDAHAALVGQLGPRPIYALGLRSGTLIDAASPLTGRWHLSPMTGTEVIAALLRLRAAAGERISRDTLLASRAPIAFAGNVVAPDMLAELEAASPIRSAPRHRVVTLSSPPACAPAKAGAQTGLPPSREHMGSESRTIPAFPPWRRAEPGHDPALAALLADDIAAWIARCEA